MTAPDVRCLVLDVHGVAIVGTHGAENATYLMNRLAGAALVRTFAGVPLASRHYVNASSVSEWLMGQGRWAS